MLSLSLLDSFGRGCLVTELLLLREDRAVAEEEEEAGGLDARLTGNGAAALKRAGTRLLTMERMKPVDPTVCRFA